MKITPAVAGTRINITDLNPQQIYELAEHRQGVYWLYDSEDKLLYTGRASDIGYRLLQHRCKKTWWPEVTRKVAAWYDTSTEVQTAEALAIFQEKPLYNKRQEPLPFSNPVDHGAWLHVTSTDVAERRLDTLIAESKDYSLHIGIKSRRNKGALAGVIVPIGWYQQALETLAGEDAARQNP